RLADPRRYRDDVQRVSAKLEYLVEYAHVGPVEDIAPDREDGFLVRRARSSGIGRCNAGACGISALVRSGGHQVLSRDCHNPNVTCSLWQCGCRTKGDLRWRRYRAIAYRVIWTRPARVPGAQPR